MEWVEHPLQTILLTVAEHIVIHKKKDAFDLFRRDSFVTWSLMSCDTNHIIYIIKCPCWLAHIGKMLWPFVMGTSEWGAQPRVGDVIRFHPAEDSDDAWELACLGVLCKCQLSESPCGHGAAGMPRCLCSMPSRHAVLVAGSQLTAGAAATSQCRCCWWVLLAPAPRCPALLLVSCRKP